MKKLLKYLFFNSGYLLSYIYTYKVSRLIKIFKTYYISGYIKRNFKTCGKNLTIEPPFFYYNLHNVEIGDNFLTFRNLRLETFDEHIGYKFTPKIKIGNNVSINYDCHIGCINNIEIGNNVLIASRVFITDHFHGGTEKTDLMLPPSERKAVSKGPVIIEDNVWIGEGAVILPNVRIGKNSIIGANAVVTKSFPPNSIIGGIPAKLIRSIIT